MYTFCKYSSAQWNEFSEFTELQHGLISTEYLLK